MLLKEYFSNIGKDFVNHKFSGISFNSNEVKKGYIIFAIKGNRVDGKKFINKAIKNGAKTINRPKEISGDAASSESGWLHALDIIEIKIGNIDWVFAPQVTSPLRSKDDRLYQWIQYALLPQKCVDGVRKALDKV